MVFKFLAVLQAKYHIVGVLKLAVVGVFTSDKTENATNKGFLFTPEELTV